MRDSRDRERGFEFTTTSRRKLDPATRNLFSTYSRSFGILTDRKISIENKRKHLTQKGGALPLLDPLLGSALLSIGSGFIYRILKRGENNG